MSEVDQVLKILLAQMRPIGTEHVPISLALHRVLAQDVFAAGSFPHFDRSAMDGYAVMSADTQNAGKKNPVRIPIAGVIRAGMPAEKTLEKGTTLKIMTGAPMPSKADTIIPFEQVEEHKHDIRIYSPVPPGKNVILKGEHIRSGECVLKRGKPLSAVQLGTLASLGLTAVSVYRRPSVAAMITGDEFAAPGEALASGQIYDANTVLLPALFQEQFLQVSSLLSYPDDLGKITSGIHSALQKYDVVVTSGGVSRGDYDFIVKALQEIGAEIQIEQVSIKPGKPFVFATFGTHYFFGLPGNPLSVINLFQTLLKPAVDKLKGKQTMGYPVVNMRLDEEMENTSGRRIYLFGTAEYRDGQYFFKRDWNQSSNHLFGCNRSNSAIWLEANSGLHHKGEYVPGRLMER